MNLFYQICECEGYQEAITSLKQQLSDALESQNVSPISTYSHRFAEMKGLQMDKEVAASKDNSEDLLIKAQVLIK